MTAELLMLLGGAGAFLLTVCWVRMRRLRVKYALMWLFLSFLLLIAGAFPVIIKNFAQWARLSFPAAVLFLALVLIYLFSFAVSISLSRLHHRNLRLTQEVGLLEMRLRDLEKECDVSKKKAIS